MDHNSVSPFFVILFFILRCVVPLLILMAISYLLRKFGLVAEPHKRSPKDQSTHTHQNAQGGLDHGKT